MIGSIQTVLATPQVTTNVDPTTLSLYHSQMQTVTVSLKNNGGWCSYYCEIYKDNSYQSTVNPISPGQTQNYNLPITAPSAGSGSQTIQIGIKCNNIYGFGCGQDWYNTTNSISLNFGPSPEEQTQQNAQTSAYSAIQTASQLISDAQSSISSAQSKITEATNKGADITSASYSLSTAKTNLQNAQTFLSSANTAYNGGNYNSASSSAQSAQNSASQAKSSADSAKSAAEQALQNVNQAKTVASNKISNANSAIATAKDSATKAENLINNATIIGMDTTSAEANVATARAKIASAENYNKEASSAFSSGNYDLVTSKAETSKSYAQDADTIATSAYNALWNVYAEKREAGEAISSADEKVSQVNQIYTKLDYVLRSMKAYSVNVADTEDAVTNAKSSVNAAEDLLSQAKNKIASGLNTEGVQDANSAKTQADSAYNRLDSVTEKLSFNIEDGIKAANDQLNIKFNQAKSNVEGAAGTYGADPNAVLAVQNALSDAQNGMSNVTTYTNNVKSAASLSDLVSNAELAFVAISDAQNSIDNANAKANAVRNALITTVVTGGAVVGGAAGGGFLYWRKKKKGSIGKIEKVTTGHKIESVKKSKEDEQKKDEKSNEKFCKNCGAKLDKENKFCHKCGNKAK